MARYRKKPVEIEALQFIDDVDRITELSNFIDNQDVRVSYKDPKNPKLLILCLALEMFLKFLKFYTKIVLLG